MQSKVVSVLLVLVQFGCLTVLALTGPVIASGWILWVEILAFIIAFWGIWSMRRTRLNAFPEVLEGSRLIQSGLYKFIRHPMYLSLLILSVSLLLDYYSHIRLAAALVLLADLLFKIEWEEAILVKEFPEYNTYRKKTWKIIPGVY